MRCRAGRRRGGAGRARPVMERSVAAAAGLAIPSLRTGDRPRAGRDRRPSRRAPRCGGRRSGSRRRPIRHGHPALSLLARIELALGAVRERRRACAGRSGDRRRPTCKPDVGRTRSLVLAVWRSPAASRREAERLAHEALCAASSTSYRPLSRPRSTSSPPSRPALESFEESARILGAAERAREELGHVRWEPEQATVDALESASAPQLGEAAFAEAFAQGARDEHRSRRSAGCAARAARASARRAAGSR